MLLKFVNSDGTDVWIDPALVRAVSPRDVSYGASVVKPRRSYVIGPFTYLSDGAPHLVVQGTPNAVAGRINRALRGQADAVEATE